MYRNHIHTTFLHKEQTGHVAKFGRFFRSIPDLAVFRRFPGLFRSGLYKLSSGP